MTGQVEIREAAEDDATDLARLSAQLGYPCSAMDVRERLSRQRGKADRTVLVADTEGRVVGWASAEVIDRFYFDPMVELTGFVVDEDFRRMGIGRRLIEAVETWVRAKRKDTLRLRTNITRKEAHSFYESLGFERVKQSYTYSKKL